MNQKTLHKSYSNDIARKKILIRFCLIGPFIPVLLGITAFISYLAYSMIFSRTIDEGFIFTLMLIVGAITLALPVGIIPATLSSLLFTEIALKYDLLFKQGKFYWALNLISGAVSGLFIGIIIDLLIITFSSNSDFFFFTVCSSLSAAFCAILARRSLLKAFPNRVARNV